MQALDPCSLDAVHKRFGDFHDAVIPEIHIGMNTRKKFVRVVLEAIDLDRANGSDRSWSRVEFEVSNVSEFCLRYPDFYFIVFSGGIAVREGQFELGFDLTRFPSPSERIRVSDFFIVGKNLTWEVTELTNSKW